MLDYSTWGDAWGFSWGDAWGCVEADTPQQIGDDAPGGKRIIRRDLEKRKYERMQRALKDLEQAERSDTPRARKKAAKAVERINAIEPFTVAPVERAAPYKSQIKQIRAAQVAVAEAIAAYEARERKRKRNNDAVMALLLAM